MTPCCPPATIPFPCSPLQEKAPKNCSILIIPQFQSPSSDLTLFDHFKARHLSHTSPLSGFRQTALDGHIAKPEGWFPYLSLTCQLHFRQLITISWWILILLLGFQVNRFWYLSLFQRLLAHSFLLVFPSPELFNFGMSTSHFKCNMSKTNLDFFQSTCSSYNPSPQYITIHFFHCF